MPPYEFLLMDFGSARLDAGAAYHFAPLLGLGDVSAKFREHHRDASRARIVGFASRR
jgi:hypothetical protein